MICDMPIWNMCKIYYRFVKQGLIINDEHSCSKYVLLTANMCLL